jgi:hypothetical protein
MSALLENFQSCRMCYKAGSAAVKMLAVSCPPASYFLSGVTNARAFFSTNAGESQSNSISCICIPTY